MAGGGTSRLAMSRLTVIQSKKSTLPPRLTSAKIFNGGIEREGATVVGAATMGVGAVIGLGGISKLLHSPYPG